MKGMLQGFYVFMFHIILVTQDLQIIIIITDLFAIDCARCTEARLRERIRLFQ